MKILIALDSHAYSFHAMEQAVRLAANTFADIILLNIFPKKMAADANAIDIRLKEFLDSLEKTGAPYLIDVEKLMKENGADIREKTITDPGSGKELCFSIRSGDPVRIILEESQVKGCDLVVLGCETARQCIWQTGGNVPYKVAMDAQCSVMVVKKKSDTDRILCCLDHDDTSQESLEMISQMSTLLSADLEIVGLTKNRVLKETVQQKLEKLLTYYLSKGIQPWTELVDISELDEFISPKNRWSLIAMWMGKKSIFKLIFPGRNVKRLLKKSESSVLLLR